MKDIIIGGVLVAIVTTIAWVINGSNQQGARIDRLEYNTYVMCKHMQGVDTINCIKILSASNPNKGLVHEENKGV